MLDWIELPRLDYGRMPGDALTTVALDLDRRGWAVVPEAVAGLSRANPFTRTMRLAHGGRSRSDVALLVHEHTHVRQWGDGWRRWWRGLVYLAVPGVRWRVEVEATAHALVWEWGDRAAVWAARLDVSRLCGLRWPYVTLASARKVRARLLGRVGAIG